MPVPSDIDRLRYRNKLYVVVPVAIAGLAWGLANATTWWAGLLFGVGVLILVWFAGIVGSVLADRSNRSKSGGQGDDKGSAVAE